MKCITVKQPWASLIVEGYKSIENRMWATKFRGPTLIHTSAKYAHPHPWELLTDEQFATLPGSVQTDMLLRDYPVSAIIGQVEIVDCVINHPSIWAEITEIPAGVYMGEKPIYNWVLDNPVKFDKPIQNVKGKLSFWEFEL
ncbi:MAG TPA: ASCH domain-containing protein [Parapedobacter sp.]|uniref:ASCH domain-containing protein n=1 Tax=Parapedobacter sp. TaxID=1958893 RepID=UPI002D00AB49|nr:ASCH domain-containing protein [Parapedobacter sp.]HWK58128.1 ASCH domain-containing protein [Parapedobacter sp.]